MRTVLSLAVLVTLTAGVAQAQQPVDPYGTADVAGPATEPPQVVDPYAPAAPVDPYAEPARPAYPPPGQFGYQPPSAGPGVVSPAPPSYQRGYYLYPSTGGQYPVYYAPGSGCYCACDACATARPRAYSLAYPTVVRKPVPYERVRRFSLGAHAMVLGLFNAIGHDDMTLGGAGIQLRIRSRGRFGLELNQSFLHGDAFKGAISRSSYPFQFSLMLYLFPNQDKRHFNLYGLAGFGAQLDQVDIRNQYGDKTEQDFLEFEGHIGLGAELRFKWFAIAADVRGLGLVRDDSSTPASYYKNQPNAPVADSGWGLSGNAYVNLWF